MNMQELLCNEFCGMLSVREVPCGLAIGTGYEGVDGDPLGFFVVGPDSEGCYRIEDDGLSVTLIEAMGADLNTKTRAEAFQSLLDTYGAEFDDDAGEIHTGPLPKEQVASAALRFIALLLRLEDLLLMSQERVASTFKEDVRRVLLAQLGNRATVRTNHVIHEELKDCPADLAIYGEGRDPVAVFLGTSDVKVLEALLLQSYAELKHVPCSVVALLETQEGVSAKMRQRASNHLDAVPVFRGAEVEACARIAREATGSPSVH